MAKQPSRQPRRDAGPVGKGSKAPVVVSVHVPGGRSLERLADVVLLRGKQRFALKKTAGRAVYEGSVEPGEYTLRVAASGYSTPDRRVTIPLEGKTLSSYFGKASWPFYRYGENIVPFEPREDLLAVCFESRMPPARVAIAYAEQLTRRFALDRVEYAADREIPFAAADGAIWLFRITKASHEKIRTAVARWIREPFGDVARVGMPVDVIRGQVKVIDNRFVVRFRDHVKPSEIERLARDAGARILRGFVQAGNARLLEFLQGSYRTHLRTVEEWFSKELLVYGEPDLMSELTDDIFPADPPNDGTYPNQNNLTLQNVDKAWQFLASVDPAITLGDPDVYVATIDSGVDTDHPDIGGNLTDGTAQLAQCYDFGGLSPCTAAGYAPYSSHGMGVYGIVAALTNNTTGIAGIAPNAHQFGLKRPALKSANYPDTLLWAAGIVTGNTSVGWPAEPVSPAADIISCSHGVDGLALSGIMDDTLRYLSVYGRGGRGTLIIYSAGNAFPSQVITGFRVWAAHPRTLAISNSMQPDAGGLERLDQTSNFGPEIDICAQGENAPSLNDTGGEQVFGGTSAAAPTVAAAAALMLAAEPNLTWVNLRDLLRQTAVQIDPLNADPQGKWLAGFSWWYGFGRLDVDAAVRAADAFDPGTVNLVLRDNLADTGAFVPSGGVFWRSPDLWVRATDPTGDPVPAYSVDPPHENAQFGQDNWVQVRVRNRGTAPSGDFLVRAYLTHFAGSQFQYPTDYVPTINSGDPIPNPLVQGAYLIGEQQGTRLASGADQVFTFLWPAALVPPEEVAGASWHPCLLAEVSPHTAPQPSGTVVADNKNLCQRNITISSPDDDDVHEMAGVMGHKDDHDRVKRLVVCRGTLPKKARVWVRFLDRRVDEAVAAHLRTPDSASTCGCTPKPCDCQTHLTRPKDRAAIDRLNGQRIFRVGSSGCFRLDVPMVSGPLTPVILGCWIPKGTTAGTYEVVLIEQSGTGRALGAFALHAVVE